MREARIVSTVAPTIPGIPGIPGIQAIEAPELSAPTPPAAPPSTHKLSLKIPSENIEHFVRGEGQQLHQLFLQLKISTSQGEDGDSRVDENEDLDDDL